MTCDRDRTPCDRAGTSMLPVGVALLVIYALPALAQTKPAVRLDLSRGWVFKADTGGRISASEWQKADFDDRDWRPIRVDVGYIPQGVRYEPYTFYRLRFRVPEDWRGRISALCLGPIDDTDETYLNGRCIGKTGFEGGANEIWPSHQPRVYPVQPGWLRPGRENVLAVKVVNWDNTNTARGGGFFRGPVRLEAARSTISDVQSIAERPWGVEIKLWNGAVVRLQAYSDRVIRVRMAPHGRFRHLLAHDLILARPEPERADFTFAKSADAAVLRTHSMQLWIELRPFRLGFRDRGGRLLTEQASGAWWGGGWLGDSFTCREDEHFLGLGEHGPHVDRRGTQERMWVRHTFEANDIAVPFLISSAGYGLFFCNSFDGYVDAASTSSDLVQFRSEGGEVDYFVIVGNPKEAIGLYTWLTGRAPLPPRWAFGYWQSPATEGTQDWAIETVTRLRKSGFPLDALHMDGWNWGSSGLSFTPRRFRDGNAGAREMLRWLDERGVKLSVWETPFLWPGYPPLDEALKNGYLAADRRGRPYRTTAWIGTNLGIIDFLNPRACEWWQDLHAPIIAMGVDCVMCDGGDGNEIPPDTVFGAEYSGREVHNLFPQLFSRCITEAQEKRKPDERVIIWTRTGFAGSQRYPLTWGGDEESSFEGLRILVRAGMNAGICGFPYWAQDSGGFTRNRTAEYYARSCEWGFLSPIAMILGVRENADPAFIGNEPWSFGPRVEEIVRKYARLRYRLLPYIYSCAVEAWETGAPMMRALPLEFPDDPRTYACDYQYMFGSAIMVAPIYEKSSAEDLSATRKVYLPRGLWYDFWTDRAYRGPAEIEYTAAFDVLPIFVRAGAIIPFGPDLDYIDGPPAAPLTVHVYPGASGEFELREDDGLSLAYRRGESARTRIRCQGTKRDVALRMEAPRGFYKGIPAGRPVSFRFHALPGEASVRVNSASRGFEVRRENGDLLVGPVQVRGRTEVSVSTGVPSSRR